MAGSGGDSVFLELLGEVVLPSKGHTCDFDPPSTHPNYRGRRCAKSATISGANSNCKHQTWQKQHHIHGPYRQTSSFSLAQWWKFSHTPGCAKSLHNSLWYFIIVVLMFSQSLLVSAEFTRTPSNARPTLGDDVILQCASSKPPSDLIWQQGPQGTVLFWGGNTPARFSKVNQTDLKISGVTLLDSTSYTCLVNGLGSRTATVTVLVTPGEPVITASASLLTEGNPLSLNCTSSGGNPKPSLIWKRNGQVMPNAEATVSSPESGGASYRVLNIQLQKSDHQAIYTCEAFNEVNEGQPATASRTLQVRYSPRVSFSPYNPYVAILGDRVTLKCEVDAYPTNGMTYRWEKDGVQRPQISDTLLFSSVEKTDKGTYTCTVSNGVGQGQSESVVLDVQYKPEIVNLPSRVIVNVSDAVNITCASDANPRPRSTKWTSSRGNVYFGSNLVISSIFQSESDNYTCEVSNVLTPSDPNRNPDNEPVTKVMELLVQHPPGEPVFLPLNSPDVGDRVELKCQLPDPGYPAGSVEWQKEGRSEILSVEVFVIQAASLSDSGTYMCRGKNLIGSGVWKSMNLIVNEPPTFVSTLPAVRNVNISERDLKLECKARGRPRPDIQWMKNGIPFDQGGDGDFFEIVAGPVQPVDTYSYIVTSTLHFKGFQRLHQLDGREDLLLITDTGNYTCAAGGQSQTIQIFVQYAPVVTVTPRKVAQSSNNATFICLAKANPEPVFQWHFNDVALNSAGKYRIQSGGRGFQEFEYTTVLTVNNIAQPDHGQYKCTATNTMGSNFQSAAIVDRSTPDASTGLKVRGRTWNSIYLEWEAGFNGGEDQTFMVQYTSDDHSGSVEAVKQAVNVTGLYASTWYMLTVVGINSLGTGPQSSPINTTTTEYNFTMPTAVKFDHASNTLSFEEPVGAYFAKVEVLVDDQTGWVVSEDRANTEGGSIKLKENNIKKCRVSFCLETPPQQCSTPVLAQPVGEPTKPASGDLSTEGVVIIACVCAIIIIGLCIALFCVIRKRRQDKAAKDYELETQANRRSQPINNPKDIGPKRGYDNPDFSSHQIQRNGHVAPVPIANGKINHPYKPPMNTDNSFESGDMHKFDEYDHNIHQSYGDEPLAFIPYSSLYYSQGDPHYNYDGPRGDYIDRPPSHLKDPSVSGQESGYSTPEPTKPKKLPKFLQRKRGLVYYADSAAFAHNPPGHTCGLPCCQTGNDLQILLGSSRSNCVGMQTSCHSSNFSLGRANRNLLQGRPTFKNGNFSLRPFTNAERSRLPNFDDVQSSSNGQITFTTKKGDPYHLSGNSVQDSNNEQLHLSNFAVGESADDFEDSDGPSPYYQILPVSQNPGLKLNSQIRKDRSDTSEGDSGVYDRPESTESLHHVYAALPVRGNKSGNPSESQPDKPRVPPSYAEAMAARLAKKLAALNTADGESPQHAPPDGVPDGPDDRYSSFPKRTPFMSGMASGLMNSFPDQPAGDPRSVSQTSSDIEEELGYFDEEKHNDTFFECDVQSDISVQNSPPPPADEEAAVDDCRRSSSPKARHPNQTLYTITDDHSAENSEEDSQWTDTAPITLIL